MNVTCALGQFKFVPPSPVVKEEFTPTQERPGSKAKMAVLNQRLEQGLPLHHTEDNKAIDPLGMGWLLDGEEYTEPLGVA